MKRIAAAVLICLVYVVAAHAQANCTVDQEKVKEFGRYTDSSHGWVVLVVPPKMKDECLVGLVRHLHKANPETRFELFDNDGPELQEYFDWAKGGMEDSAPYPEKWFEKHHLGMINAMLDGWEFTGRNKGDSIPLDQ